MFKGLGQSLHKHSGIPVNQVHVIPSGSIFSHRFLVVRTARAPVRACVCVCACVCVTCVRACGGGGGDVCVCV